MSHPPGSVQSWALADGVVTADKLSPELASLQGQPGPQGPQGPQGPPGPPGAPPDPSSLALGGDLGGTLANALIANDAVTTDKVADAAITAAKLANNSVTGEKIAIGSIRAADIGLVDRYPLTAGTIDPGQCRQVVNFSSNWNGAFVIPTMAQVTDVTDLEPHVHYIPAGGNAYGGYTLRICNRGTAARQTPAFVDVLTIRW